MDEVMEQTNLIYNKYVNDNVEVDNSFEHDGNLTKNEYQKSKKILTDTYNTRLNNLITDELRELAPKIVTTCEHNFQPIHEFDAGFKLYRNKLSTSTKHYFIYKTPIEYHNHIYLNSPYKEPSEPGVFNQCLDINDINQYKCNCIHICQKCNAYTYFGCDKCDNDYY